MSEHISTGPIEPYEDWSAEVLYTLRPSGYPLAEYDLIEADNTGAAGEPTVMHLSRGALVWLHDSTAAALAATQDGPASTVRTRDTAEQTAADELLDLMDGGTL